MNIHAILFILMTLSLSPLMKEKSHCSHYISFWQSMLQGKRSPDVGERETQRRVKEAETLGARLFGGDFGGMLGSVLDQHPVFLVGYVTNLGRGKKRHNDILKRLSELLNN